MTRNTKEQNNVPMGMDAGQAAGKTRLADHIMSTNPLYNKDGDTTAVSAALQFLAKSFAQADPDAINLNYSECFGLSCLLKSCSSALDVMDQTISRNKEA